MATKVTHWLKSAFSAMRYLTVVEIAAAGVIIGLGRWELAALVAILAVTWRCALLLVQRRECHRLVEALGRIQPRQMLWWLLPVVLFTATLSRVLILPGIYSPILFRFLLVVFVAIAMIQLLVRPVRLSPWLGVSVLLLGLWVIWQFVTLLWASDLTAAARYLGLLLIRLVLVIAPSAIITNTRRLRVVFGVLILSYFIIAGIGLVEIVTGLHLPVSRIATAPERFQRQITSIFYNPNDFASFLSLWFPLWLSLLFGASRGWQAGLAGLAVVLTMLEMERTGARLGWVALALGSVAMGMVRVVRVVLARRWLSLEPRLLLGMASLLGIVCLLWPAVGAQGPLAQAAGRIQDARDQLSRALNEIQWETGSPGDRLSLLRNGWSLLQEYHLAGVGPGNAEYHMPFFSDNRGLGLVNLHCWWMETLVNGGLVGFFLFAGFYFSLIRGTLQVALESSDHLMTWTGIGLFASLVAFAVGAFSPSSIIHLTPPWVHLGLALAVISVFWHECACLGVSWGASTACDEG